MDYLRSREKETWEKGREARKKIRKRERPLGGEDIWGLWEGIKRNV